jgi:hypothetical protein
VCRSEAVENGPASRTAQLVAKEWSGRVNVLQVSATAVGSASVLNRPVPTCLLLSPFLPVQFGSTQSNGTFGSNAVDNKSIRFASSPSCSEL